MNVEKRLQEKGYILPVSTPPIASYVNGRITGSLLFISGKLPLENGKVKYTGKVGRDLSIDEGYSAAKLSCLHVLASAKEILGDLDRIKSVVKLTGYVNTAEGFTDVPKVVNGASDLLVEIFGENGRHARAAIGVAELPLNSSVEIEAIFEIR